MPVAQQGGLGLAGGAAGEEPYGHRVGVDVGIGGTLGLLEARLQLAGAEQLESPHVPIRARVASSVTTSAGATRSTTDRSRSSASR